jgi:hypothetical protein
MMNSTKRLGFAVLLNVAVMVPAAGAGSAMSSPNSQTKVTKSYVFKLSVGMAEQMWTPAQVRSKHPQTGEVMLTGAMGGGMAMGGAQRHIEVHIKARATGNVVNGTAPVISVVEAGLAKAQPMKVPVDKMQGVSVGAADLHYGNNFALISGHSYKITVSLGGEQAFFLIKSPNG